MWRHCMVVLILSCICPRGVIADGDEPRPVGASSEEATPVTSTTAEGDEIETTVTARKPVTAASSTTVRDRDLKLRPKRRPADVLEVTPGLYTVQHAGGGKANQYFLRGFDADHGTDVALSVDGIPVNAVSHGHGQGYADLHWLIPELVDRVEVRKGLYFADLGDFATAGGINLVTKRSFEVNQATFTGGSFGTARLLALLSSPRSDLKPLIAGEVYRTDGPFKTPEKTERYNIFSKFTKDFSSSASLSAGLTSYQGRWNASGQIPLREVNAGRLDRFGTLDPTEGGNSERHGAYGLFEWRPGQNHEVRVMSFAAYSRLDLFSNFTFFSRDAANGDQIQQADNRVTYGGQAQYRNLSRVSGISFLTTVGFQGRRDGITNALRYTQQRRLLSRFSENDVRQYSAALFANEEVIWSPWLRTHLGGRVDHYTWGVTDRQAGVDQGTRSKNLASPKASVIVTPFGKTELFANFGMGFHSNDARGIFDGSAPASRLTRATGYELGARTRVLDERLDVAAAAFWVDLDDELVYVGDAGGTESVGGPTRRRGIELEARYRIASWLYADADATFVSARIQGAAAGSDRVPLAPTRLLGGGLSAQHPSGYFGRLGFFHVADRPLTEDAFLTAEGFMRFDATVGYRRKQFELSLAVQNLFNTKWREAQFATVSKLTGETAASCPAGTRAVNDTSGAFSGCEDVHFTPGAPLNVQATASVFF